MHTVVSRQAFQGVTPSFHLSEYQFSKDCVFLMKAPFTLSYITQLGTNLFS